MRLSRTIVIASSIIAVISFIFYICPLNAVILTNEQMNEILLAVLGAGISSLFVGAIEYCDCCRELEDRFLFGIEPLLSALGGLDECCIGSLSTPEDTLGLLLAYYEEEESRAFWLSVISDAKHEQRDRLIQAIEHCEKDECERYYSDKTSSTRRYLLRLENDIKKSVRRYLRLADKLPSEDDVYILSSKFAYFPGSWKLKQMTAIAEKINAIRNDYQDVVGKCRLFNCGNCGYSELLTAIKKCEKAQTRYDREGRARSDRDAYELYVLVYEFASRCHSPYAEKYEEVPWWEKAESE